MPKKEEGGMQEGDSRKTKNKTVAVFVASSTNGHLLHLQRPRGVRSGNFWYKEDECPFIIKNRQVR